MTLIPPFLSDLTQPIIGYVSAAASAGIYWVAQTSEVVAPVRGWMEFGGTVGLIGGLSYGCVTLWKELQRVRSEANTQLENSRKEIADLNKEIRGEWKTQNDKLIAVLDRLDTNS